MLSIALLRFQQLMMVYQIKTFQHLPVSIETAWRFFSSPANLNLITPPDMHFKIVPGYEESKMHPGQIIQYKIQPFSGFNMSWVTEITHVHEPFLFVDEQRSGPYKLWHHQHSFHEIPGGTAMKDEVHYSLPLGIIGQAVHAMIVKRRLEYVFKFRFEKLETIFGKMPSKVTSIESAGQQ